MTNKQCLAIVTAIMCASRQHEEDGTVQGMNEADGIMQAIGFDYDTNKYIKEDEK